MSIARFTLLLFALLVPCFAVWSLLNPLLVKPAIGLLHAILTHAIPDVVANVIPQANKAMVMTRFGELDGSIVRDTLAGWAMGIPQDTRLLSYSIPFYTALHLASFRLNKMALWGWGIAGLYVVLVTGMCCVSLKNIMLQIGPTAGILTAEWSRNLVALGYQFSVLILPTLAPVLLWLSQGGQQAVLLNKR